MSFNIYIMPVMAHSCQSYISQWSLVFLLLGGSPSLLQCLLFGSGQWERLHMLHSNTDMKATL